MTRVVCHVLQPDNGGVPNYVRQLVTGLRARGWDSIVIGPGELAGSFDAEKFVALDVPRGPQPASDLRAVLAVRRTVERTPVALLHTHATKAGLVGAIAGRATKTPVVHSPHAWPFQMDTSRAAQRAYALWERAATTLLRERVIAVSPSERDSAVHHRVGVDRISVVPTGLVRREAVDRDAARRSLNIPASDRVACWIGRDAPQKQPQDLGALATRLSAVGVRLVVMGDGMPASEWYGEITRAGGIVLESKDAWSLICASDLLVHTAAWEGLPLVALEAMSAGRPVVGYASAGLADAVEQNVTGSLVPPGAVDQLAAAVHRLTTDPMRSAAFGAAARRRCREAFDYDAMVDRIAEIYTEVARGPREISGAGPHQFPVRTMSDERSA